MKYQEDIVSDALILSDTLLIFLSQMYFSENIHITGLINCIHRLTNENYILKTGEGLLNNSVEIKYNNLGERNADTYSKEVQPTENP